MRSPLTSASRSPSSTRALALACAAGLSLGASCDGDPECGTGGAPASGIVAAGDQANLEFGNMTAGENNDCPAADAPEGVISVTIQAVQTNGTGLFTLCIERPDKLNSTQALGLNMAGTPVHVVDVTGMSSGCSFELDTTVTPTGTARAEGACANGVDPAGFALVLDGTISLERTCGATVDTIPATLSGRVAVLPQ